MSMETGITLYFRHDTILVRSKTIQELKYPKYIHLLVNEKKKYLFIQNCELDRDAFKVDYLRQYKDRKNQIRYRIFAKPLLRYLAKVINVSFDSDSLWFAGALMDDGKTIFVNLKEYQVIPYDELLE